MGTQVQPPRLRKPDGSLPARRLARCRFRDRPGVDMEARRMVPAGQNTARRGRLRQVHVIAKSPGVQSQTTGPRRSETRAHDGFRSSARNGQEDRGRSQRRTLANSDPRSARQHGSSSQRRDSASQLGGKPDARTGRSSSNRSAQQRGNRGCRRESGFLNHRPVDMTCVPQIPARAHQLLALGYRELPPDVEAEANAAIAAAMRELQLRKLETITATFDNEPDPDLSDFEE